MGLQPRRHRRPDGGVRARDGAEGDELRGSWFSARRLAVRHELTVGAEQLAAVARGDDRLADRGTTEGDRGVAEG